MREYKKADARNPHMGLHNRVCRNPAYWCRLHRVWLSEKDARKKQCKHRPTIDMLGFSRCSNLVERSKWEEGRERKNGRINHKDRERADHNPR